MTEQQIIECPDGYYAVESKGCTGCAFNIQEGFYGDCCADESCPNCAPSDGLSVIFKKIEDQQVKGAIEMSNCKLCEGEETSMKLTVEQILEIATKNRKIGNYGRLQMLLEQAVGVIGGEL